MSETGKKRLAILLVVIMFLHSFIPISLASASEHVGGLAEEDFTDYEPDGTVAHYPLNKTYQAKNKLDESQAQIGNDSPAWKEDYVSLLRANNNNDSNKGHIAGNYNGEKITGDEISFSFNVKVNSVQTRSSSAAEQPMRTIFMYGEDTGNAHLTLRYWYDGVNGTKSAAVLSQSGRDEVVAEFDRPAADVWHNYSISLDGASGGKLTVWVNGNQVASVDSKKIGPTLVGSKVLRLNRHAGSNTSNVDCHYRDVRIIKGLITQSDSQKLTREIGEFAFYDYLFGITLNDGAVVRTDLKLVQTYGLTWSSDKPDIINPETGRVVRPNQDEDTAEVTLTLEFMGMTKVYTITVPKIEGKYDSILVAHYPLNNTYMTQNRLDLSQRALASDNAAWRADYVSVVNSDLHKGHVAENNNPLPKITGKEIAFSLNIKLNRIQSRNNAGNPSNTIFAWGANGDNNITIRPYYSDSEAAVVLVKGGKEEVAAKFDAPAADMWHNYVISLDGTANTGKLMVWLDGVKVAEESSKGIGPEELGQTQFRLNRTISTFSNLDAHYRDVRVFSGVLDDADALEFIKEIDSFVWSDLLAMKPLADNQVVRQDLNLLTGSPWLSWTSSDESLVNSQTGKVTRPEKGTGVKMVTLTMKYFDYTKEYNLRVMPYDAGDYLIADFNFDDGTTGLVGAGAKAVVQGTATYVDSMAENKKAARIGSGFWLNVMKEDGSPLLQDLEEITISYDSKAYGGAGWTFYAAPNEEVQIYNEEKYLGIMDKENSVTVERYYNTGVRPNNPTSESDTEWKHVDVVISRDKTTLYIDGKIKAEEASIHKLKDILTSQGGILWIGKGNWGTGEYFEGFIDNFQIFNVALTLEDLVEYRVTNLPPVITPAGPETFEKITITHPAGQKYIYYTTDGSEPTLDSRQYAGPFTVTGDVTVKAAAILPDGKKSETNTVQFYASEWMAAATPFAIQGEGSVNNIKVRWPLIEGVDYYEVYRDGEKLTRTYGDIYDEYGLEIDREYTYTVKAVRGQEVIREAFTNNAKTFSYNPENIIKVKNNYTGEEKSYAGGGTYGVKIGETWYNYKYGAVDSSITGELSEGTRVTGLWEQTSTDGKNYGEWKLLAPYFINMRVEGAGWMLHADKETIIFTAHGEGNTGYATAKLFIASFKPGKGGAPVTIDSNSGVVVAQDGTEIPEQTEQFTDYASNMLSSYYVGRPLGLDSHDMVSFVDGDKAYIFSAVRNNSNTAIIQLDEKWEKPAILLQEAFKGKHKESPSIIKYDGRYYFFASTANGWYPSQAEYASTTDLSKSWTPLRPVANATSYSTQANGFWGVGTEEAPLFLQNGYHWGGQYPADFREPHYTRQWPVALREGLALSAWFGTIHYDEVYGAIPVQAGEYISLGKKAMDSTGLDATAVTDGSDTAQSARVVHNTIPYNIVIDLEQPSVLEEISFSTRLVYGSDTVFRYKLEGSPDNTNWTTLIDGSQNNCPGFVANVIEDSNPYRYVKLTVNSIINVHNKQGATWADGIYEIMVFGTSATDKSKLQEKYDEVKDIQRDTYTDATWMTITRALYNAKKVLEDEKADQWTIDRALLQIEEAFIFYRNGVAYEVALTVQSENIKDYSQIGIPVGETWYDTEGNPIQAHGGGFLQQTHEDGKPIYYWVGENKIHNGAFLYAVSLYSSRDLVNWKHEANIIDKFTDTVEGAEYGLLDCKWERPKIVYNKKTEKYVLYGHWETAGSYASSQIAVATADYVAGPYTFLGHWRPGGTLRNWRSQDGYHYDGKYFGSGVTDTITEAQKADASKTGYISRDFTVFVDDDETAYLVSAEGHAMRIHRLNEEYTDVDFTTYAFSDFATKAKDFESYNFYHGVGREAPAVIRGDDGYYMISSGQSGWLPNQGTISYTADIKSGEHGWSPIRGTGGLLEKYLLGNNSTYYSQPTNIMKLTDALGNKAYVYMGDRWNSGQLSDSRYVWLPITFYPENRTKDDISPIAAISYMPGWKLNLQTGEIQLPEVSLVSQGKSATITNNSGVAGIEKANDGISYTRNTSGDNTHFFGGLVAPYEYTIDLGEAYDLSRIDVAWRLYNGSEMYHAYEIYGSNDNTNWIKLADRNDNRAAGFTSDGLEGTYQYVKLKVNNVYRVNNNANSNNWGSGLVEVEIYSVIPKQAPPVIITNPMYTDALANSQIVEVILEQDDAEAVIYYTLDGTEPTEESQVYGTGFDVKTELKAGETIIVKAIAVKNGIISETVSKTITFLPEELTEPEAPVIITTPADTDGVENGENVTVTLVAVTTGSAIYYTLDNTIPTENSRVYEGAFDITTDLKAGETIVVQAIGVKDGLVSQTASKAITFLAAEETVEPEAPKAPAIITVPSDTSQIANEEAVTVTLVTATSGSAIYYTLDNTMPTMESKVYEGEFAVKTEIAAGETIVLKAITVKDGMISQITTKVLTFLAKKPVKPEVPAIITAPSDTSGVVNDEVVTVSLVTVTTGAAIYYTLDGSMPTADSQIYEGTFDVKTVREDGETIVVKAIAIKGGIASQVVSQVITFLAKEKEVQPEVPKAPVIITSPSDTSRISYDGVVTVALETSDLGTVIYYTIDGKAPTTESQRYEGVFPVKAASEYGETVILKAIAVKDGMVSQEAVKTITFLAKPTPAPEPDSTSDEESATKPVTPAPIVYLEGEKIELGEEKFKEAGKAKEDIHVIVRNKEGRELYSWKFAGEDLAGADKESGKIDLTLSMMKVSEDKNVSKLLTKDDGNDDLLNRVVIRFNHTGVLPTQAAVRIYVGDLIDRSMVNQRMYVYHYNPISNKLETLPYSSSYKVDAYGYITMNIVHCSDYVVLPKEADNSIITTLRKQISVTPDEETLYTGNTTQLKVNLPNTLEIVKKLGDKTSNSAMGGLTVSYKSSNTKVAVVDSDGKITAKGQGTAKITTTIILYSKKKATFTTTVTVKQPEVEIIKSKSTMKEGEEFTFTAKAYGVDKDVKPVWVTTEKGIVVIDRKTGKAIAKSKGTDYVKVTIGGVTKTIQVVVK